MRKTFTLGILAAALAIGGTSASYAHITPQQIRQKNATEAFRWAPSFNPTSSKWHSTTTKSFAKAPVNTTDTALLTSEQTSYLELPDGRVWFANINLIKEVISENPYYTEYNITGVDIDIYDEEYNKVGHIKDDIALPEGYERCTTVSLGAETTKKFFNSDDSFEVMLMANYKPAGAYGAESFTTVYSLKGATTDATKLLTMKGYYSAAVNNPNDAYSEDYYMVFFTGETLTDTEMIYNFEVYGKAGWGTAPVKLLSLPVDMMYVMSDGENEGIPVIINSKGRDLYVAVSRYEKTFFEDPLDFTNDKLNEDNKYLIDVYSKTGYASEATLQKQLALPCEAATGSYTMRSYMLGMFDYTNDISFDFAEDGTPALVISERQSDFRDNSETSFSVYDLDGNKIKTFGEGAAGYLPMSDINGQPSQFCFIAGTDAAPVYRFMDFPSTEIVAEIPALYHEGSDVITLSTSLDRVTSGNSYNYVFAASHGATDAGGNTYNPILWFDVNGNKVKEDRAYAGENVNLISTFISAYALDPFLINTDASQEYMILVQRLNASGDNAAHTEFCVVNDKGEMLAQIPFETADSGISVALINTTTRPAFWITWADAGDGKYHSEFISLPLNKFEGAGTVEDPYIVNTVGDWNQIRFNLNGNYILGSDIDANGAELNSITGVFNGSFDGNNRSISNFRLASKPMFEILGTSGSDSKARICNLGVSGVTLEGSADAVLARNSYNSLISNVRISGVEINDSDIFDFGTLVNTAGIGTVVSECAVDADINLPETAGVGGLTATARGTKIEASYFHGSIKAASEAAGIAATLQQDAQVVDCHVQADIEASYLIGGIVATSMRGQIANCIAEGTVNATEGGFRYNANYERIPVASTGGIVGYLQSATDNSLGGSEDAPVYDYVVKKCVAAQTAITVPADEPKLLETTHRIIGRSAANEDPEIVDEQYDDETGEWVIIWGAPREAENQIADNYAAAGLSVIQNTIEDATASTEGKTLGTDEAGQEFFAGLGYGFFGYEASAPWVPSNGMPHLYFEKNTSVSMAFSPAELTIAVGEKKQVTLLLEGIGIEDIYFVFSDDENLSANPVELDENGNVLVDVEVFSAGVYTLTAHSGDCQAVLTVTGTPSASVNNIAVATITYNGNAVIAEGEDIVLYDIAGKKIASAHGTLSTAGIAPGIYIATADKKTLKITIR